MLTHCFNNNSKTESNHLPPFKCCRFIIYFGGLQMSWRDDQETASKKRAVIEHTTEA